MSLVREGDLLYQPSDEAREGSNLARYMAWLERQRGLTFRDFDALWRWSVSDIGAFWQSTIDYYQVVLSGAPGAAVSGKMPDGMLRLPTA
jgi:acetoacetyl-CoA synthetase